MTNAIECPAYILAGGKSSRFGIDKARVEIQGQKQLPRLVKLLEPQHQVRVVADVPRRFQDLGVSSLVDVAVDCGPLAGLLAALQHRLAEFGAGWLLLVGCDQLLWQPRWSEQLLAGISQKALAVCFQQETPGQTAVKQPIPAIYHTDLLPAVAHALSARRLSLKSLLECEGSVTSQTDDNPAHWSFNTVQQLQEIMLRLEKLA